TMSERYLKDKKPTEQELRAEYENQLANLPKLEYHARHVLVATEPFAQKVVERLEKGEKFEDVAKKESMDSSKDNGGDLGWFTPDRMVKPFADAVVALKPGEYTHKPVQTQYGWHVIQLVETRDLQPPAFEQVKQRLEQVVQAKKFKAYTDELMRNAKIDKKADATPPAKAS
ncbi:MAG: peptidylprolyl isomerase, partial [Steroidobacteraceae bacterium]